MSPSLGEVGTEISIEVSSAHTFMGAEDFLGASGGFLLGNVDWASFLLINTTLIFFGGGVVGEDGSHEKIIIISGESIGIWDWDENVLFFFFVIGGVG